MVTILEAMVNVEFVNFCVFIKILGKVIDILGKIISIFNKVINILNKIISVLYRIINTGNFI